MKIKLFFDWRVPLIYLYIELSESIARAASLRQQRISTSDFLRCYERCDAMQQYYFKS